MCCVDTFARLYLPHDPPRHARMNRRDARYKYYVVHEAPTPADLSAHLSGAQTLAVPLVGPTGLSYHAALDVDHGGNAALLGVLAAAQERRWSAYALTSTNGHHCGGHVWLHLDRPAAPKRARQLAGELATAAGLSTVEVYPTQRTLRLPLGVHRWTGRRGTLLLQDGRRIDLDGSADAVADALMVIEALPRNDVGRLPAPPPTRYRIRTPQTRQEGRTATQNPIHAYNQATNLIGLLERYGARVAEAYGKGRVLLHCPCGQHHNGDAHPSLEILPARNCARYGQYVAVGHAPGCLLFTEPGHIIDSFTVYCRLEGLDAADALQRVNTRTDGVLGKAGAA